MSFDQSLEMDIFDEERSREIVVDFVQTNPGCIAEDILRGQNQIGRKKLFRILHALKEEKTIIVERRKSKVRNKKLFVNKFSPQAVVVSELKKLEKIYISILNKTVDAYNNGRYLGDWKKSSVDRDYLKILNGTALLWQPLHIFLELLKIYMIRLIIRWSPEIKDKGVLYKVNNVIFAKFTLMYIHTYKILSSVSKGGSSSSIIPTYMHIQSNANQLTNYLHDLEKYEMKQEAEELSKFMKRIFLVDEVRSYFHRKNKPYRWDLKYKDDDIIKLLKNMECHRDYIDDALYDAEMSS
jgi:hypothetical protein